jgi:uncharacterized membrane protein YeaQ/YmgE (transglycosylase-associated protein family)
MNDEPPLLCKLGGRTFLLTLGCGAITSTLLWFGKLQGGEYVTVILGTVGAFIAANAVQGVKKTQADSQVAVAAAAAGVPEQKP